MSNVDKYFKSEEDKYVYALIYTSGSLRHHMLNMSADIYDDKEKAYEWYNNILNSISKYPDENIRDEAINKLRILYHNMLKR